jgi:hypothetical protein
MNLKISPLFTQSIQYFHPLWNLRVFYSSARTIGCLKCVNAVVVVDMEVKSDFPSQSSSLLFTCISLHLEFNLARHTQSVQYSIASRRSTSDLTWPTKIDTSPPDLLFPYRIWLGRKQYGTCTSNSLFTDEINVTSFLQILNEKSNHSPGPFIMCPLHTHKISYLELFTCKLDAGMHYWFVRYCCEWNWNRFRMVLWDKAGYVHICDD